MVTWEADTMDHNSPHNLVKAAAHPVDRRRFIRGAALGLASTTDGRTRLGSGAALAQDATDGLLTSGAEIAAVWTRNFNPLFAEEMVRWPTVAGIYEPLLVHNTITGTIVPWLATSYEFSSDSLTLTFTLRDGVMWSDRHPFTSKDVAFTFDLLRIHEGLPGTGGIRRTLPFIDIIRVPDERTVTVQFRQPFTPSLYDIGHQMIVPEHIWAQIADPVMSLNEQPVGTGPFTEVSIFQDQYWELHRNPNYWQAGKPLIRGLRFPALSDGDAISLALLNGEVDWAAAFIPDIEETYVARDPAHHHYWFPSVGDVVLLYANTTRPPFDDANVRKAISMALNREQIVDLAMNGYTHPADATGLSDAYEGWKNAEAVAQGGWTKRDLTAANQLLDSLGFAWDDGTRVLPDGTRMEYELSVIAEFPDWVLACTIIASNLEEIGIAATVETYGFGIWYDLLQKGEFDLSLSFSARGPTPFDFYRATLSTETVRPVGQNALENWHRFGSEEADLLLEQFSATSDPQLQQELASQLQFLFVEHAPAIPLFPSPQWGEYNSRRFAGFPDQHNPYAQLSPWAAPDRLLVLTSLRPT
jgi:peptide/nickel transport system substrate-binding protein